MGPGRGHELAALQAAEHLDLVLLDEGANLHRAARDSHGIAIHDPHPRLAARLAEHRHRRQRRFRGHCGLRRVPDHTRGHSGQDLGVRRIGHAKGDGEGLGGGISVCDELLQLEIEATPRERREGGDVCSDVLRSRGRGDVVLRDVDAHLEERDVLQGQDGLLGFDVLEVLHVAVRHDAFELGANLAVLERFLRDPEVGSRAQRARARLVQLAPRDCVGLRGLLVATQGGPGLVESGSGGRHVVLEVARIETTQQAPLRHLLALGYRQLLETPRDLEGDLDGRVRMDLAGIRVGPSPRGRGEGHQLDGPHDLALGELFLSAAEQHRGEDQRDERGNAGVRCLHRGLQAEAPGDSSWKGREFCRAGS